MTDAELDKFLAEKVMYLKLSKSKSFWIDDKDIVYYAVHQKHNELDKWQPTKNIEQAMEAVKLLLKDWLFELHYNPFINDSAKWICVMTAFNYEYKFKRYGDTPAKAISLTIKAAVEG